MLVLDDHCWFGRKWCRETNERGPAIPRWLSPSIDSTIIDVFRHLAHGRLYKESMTGATAKSKPNSSKLDDTELARLRKQDYWLQVTRAKLVMDLIFVCKSSFILIQFHHAHNPSAYEIFDFKRSKGFITATTGLASAILRYSFYFENSSASD